MGKINLCIITHTLTHSLFCALLFTKFSTYHAWKRSNNYKQLCDEFSLSFVIKPCITMCDIISSHEWRKCVKIGVKSIIVSCVFLFTYFYCSNHPQKFSSSIKVNWTFFWGLFCTIFLMEFLRKQCEMHIITWNKNIKSSFEIFINFFILFLDFFVLMFMNEIFTNSLNFNSCSNF